MGVTFGTYDSVSGAQIYDSSRRAKLWASGAGPVVQMGQMSASRKDLTFDTLDIRHLDRTTSGNYGLANSTGAAGTQWTVYAGITVKNCFLDGYVGASLAGLTHTFTDNTWIGYGDGVVLQTLTATVLRNKCVYGEIDQLNWDGCTIIVSLTLPVTGIEFAYNDFSNHPVTNKQGTYFPAESVVGQVAPVPTGPVRVHHNKFANANQGFYCSVPNAVVEKNECWNIIRSTVAAAGTASRAIVVLGPGNVVRGNYIHSSPDARMVSVQNDQAGTNEVSSNTAIDVGSGVTDSQGGTAHSLILKNNIIIRTVGGTSTLDAERFVYTTSVVTLTASGNTFYKTAGVEGLYIGSVDKTWAQWIAGWDTTGLNTDPQVDSSGKPVAGSPSISTGVHLGYRTDRSGMQFWNPPSRGAYEYARPRVER